MRAIQMFTCRTLLPPRTSRRQGHFAQASAQSHRNKRQIDDGLFSTALTSLEIPSIDPADEDVVEITNLEYIGSYDWLKRSQHTILVPGSPRQWKDLALPHKLSPDKGSSFMDQNGHKLPSSPLLPLIAAVDVYSEMAGRPKFNWAAVDVVTDRNNLRKLLMWINDMRGERKEFRIDMQLVGTTLFLHRWEKKPKVSADRHSFGHNFEKAFTVPATGCGESSSHHRIVQYDLKGLKVVLRFEVDAALPSDGGGIDDPTASLANTSISFARAIPRTISFGDRIKLHVEAGGPPTVIPQSSLIELKTIVAKRADNYHWGQNYPQLALSKTPHHFLGVHRNGMFLRVQKQNSSSSLMMAREVKFQPALKRLRRALEDIRDLAIRHGPEARLTLVCRNKVLEVFRRTDDASMLPGSFIARVTGVSA